MSNKPSKATAEVSISPAMMAEAFWNMDTEQQADFFQSMALLIAEQEKSDDKLYGLGEMQWCYLKDELRKPDREMANKMHMAISAFAFDFWEQKPEGARS